MEGMKLYFTYKNKTMKKTKFILTQGDDLDVILMLYRKYSDIIDLCISLLKSIEVDGETMQYILEKVGQDDQMHFQLVMSKPIKDTLEILAEKVDLVSI